MQAALFIVQNISPGLLSKTDLKYNTFLSEVNMTRKLKDLYGDYEYLWLSILLKKIIVSHNDGINYHALGVGECCNLRKFGNHAKRACLFSGVLENIR